MMFVTVLQITGLYMNSGSERAVVRYMSRRERAQVWSPGERRRTSESKAFLKEKKNKWKSVEESGISYQTISDTRGIIALSCQETGGRVC